MVFATVSMKNRALARRTGSAGRSLPGLTRSAINSTMMRDSESLVDSGEGRSAGTLGPP